jgi:hypothetical protein
MKPTLREDLGAEYSKRVINARTDRDLRMNDIWALALKNYEGKAEPVDFPWPNAANAKIALTPSHTDAWQSRLYNAGTAADPVYMTAAWQADDLITEELTADEYSELYQQYSKWLEDEEIDNDAMMEKVTTIVTKYGNALVYLPWLHEEVMKISYVEGSKEPIKEPVDVLNKPVPIVIHPKNFYMDVSEEDLQVAQWCGFDEYYEEGEIRANAKSGEWDKKAANAVLKFHSAKTSKDKTKSKISGKGYFKRTEDGRIVPPNEWDDELQRTTKMPDAPVPSGINLVRIFAREDTDNDGTPEEIEILIHPESRQVVWASWGRYDHMKRPLTMFSFKWREGTWMDIGVPEMQFNTQRIMDEVARDMLNNNKIRNTKIFAVRANGVVDPDEPMYPGRSIMMENIEADFKVFDMGSGAPSTSLQDLSIFQAWAERRDGMTDFNLGRERSSRTPATTMLALLEEGNERVVAIISRQRKSQAEVWTQVHQLYVQNKDAEGLEKVLGKEPADKLRAAWASMDVFDIRKKLVLNAQVSTGELNRAIKRQETAQLMGQLDAYHQRVIQLAQIIRQTTDPVLRALAISMAKSGQFLMTRILNTHDLKTQGDMNPNLADALAKLPPGPPIATNQPGTGDANPAAQVEQAAGQDPTDPLNAPGRPEAGIPRGDGGGGDNSGSII